MKSRIIILLIIVTFLFLFSLKFFASAEEGPRKVTIISIEGLVDAMRRDNKIWEEAKEGMVLLEGDKIRTEAFSSVTLAFDEEEENIIEIDEDTEVVIDRLTIDRITKGEDTTLRMGVGGVLADIGELKIDSEFEVRTPTAVAGIRGTTWKTEVSQDLHTKVTVFKGKVDVRGIDPQGRVMPEGVVVKEGEETEVKKDKSPSRPKKIEEEKEPVGEKELEDASLSICRKDVEDVSEKLFLTHSELLNGRIKLTGRVDDGKRGADIKEIQISLDNGMSWRKAEGRTNWRYSFTPRDDEEYIIEFRVIDLNGRPYQAYFDPVEITYSSMTDDRLIRNAFAEMKDAYSSKDIDRFMSYFSEDLSMVWDGERLSFDEFRENLTEEFSQTEDVSMDIRIGSIQVSRDKADSSGTVTRKGVVTTSSVILPYTAESSTTFAFRKEEGKWKIVRMIGTSTSDTYDKEYIRQLIYTMEHAYEQEDLDEFFSHVARDFTDAEGSDWDEWKDDTEQDFTLYDAMDLSLSNIKIDVNGPLASFQFTVSFNMQESYIEGAAHQRVIDIFWKLRKEGQDWYVYEEVFSNTMSESGVFSSLSATSSTIPTTEYFDFSTGTASAASGDIYYDGANKKFIASGSAGISDSRSDSLSSIDTVPTGLLLEQEPFYSEQSISGSGGVRYFIRTNESKHFAVIDVTAAGAGSVTINWKYTP